ncbi:uronyl 2-sulfotransferase-like [Actinia tenebrosa]|uniref:Uronyl 2-sulfotransferase-like n=1 Tax=Actinia tenebrosa TaxID=6105 RepID=A0A6P8IL07_ACTTE|nr:uronyl 2-sulfotransferase-like [Actinia tenebrosa]
MFGKKAIVVALSCLAVFTTLLLIHYGRLKTKYFTSLKVTTVRPPFVSPNIQQKGIIYNRVGKCGSRSLIILMTTLSINNGFQLMNRTNTLDLSGKLRLTLRQQLEFVMSIEQLKPPFIYYTHLHFVDFRKFGAVQPIYINLIRDPLSRLVSGFYFLRFGDGRERSWRFSGPANHLNLSFNECVLKNYSECTDPRRLSYIIPYFCGQSAGCKSSPKHALRQAITNVETKYLVVGVLEEVNDFIKVLEKLLPQFFRGAYEAWKNPGLEESLKRKTTKTKQKIAPSAEVVAIMKERLKLEYQFYDYVKLKFQHLKKELGI